MIDHILRHGYVTTEELQTSTDITTLLAAREMSASKESLLRHSGLLVPEGDESGHTGSAILRGSVRLN